MLLTLTALRLRVPRCLSDSSQRLLALTALIAALWSCYPVVFCGRSFVSPNNGAPNHGGNSLLYDTVPTLPGSPSGAIADFHGADTGALMWHDVPNAFVEARALWQHGTWPLWNRFKNAGDPLLAQGISMLGDPLHLLVLCGGGAAWAWDVKFLTAKWLFCFGCGWLVLDLTRHLRLALAFSVAAAFCGLFHFVPNHPGFFVFCYTPWILLTVRRTLAETGRSQLRWGVAWVIANTGCFNAGHVEAAVVCLGGLNLTGLLHAWAESPQKRWRLAGVMSLLTLVFAGLNAPVWLPFLSYLPDSFNLHTDVTLEQFPLSQVAGLFDDAFYRAVQPGPLAEGPGGSLLVLFGMLFAMASYRELRDEMFFFINLATLLVWGGFIFGYIPVALIEHLPLIRRIGHIRADFSYLAVLQTLIASAYAGVALSRLPDARTIWRRWFAAAGGVLLVEGLFFWSTRAVTKPGDFLGYIMVVTASALVTLPLYLLVKKARGARRAFGWFALGLLLFLPQARFGLYHFGPERWLLQPGARARLDSPSPAVDWMKRATNEPFRVTGLAWDLYGGYGAVYGLEDIKGVSALMNRYYMELCTHYAGLERDSYLLEIADAAAAKNLLSMLNVRYLVLNEEDAAPDGLPFKLVAKDDLQVFQNENAWPRAFFINQLSAYRDVADFVLMLERHRDVPWAAIAERDLAAHPALQALLERPALTAMQPATHYDLGVNETSFEVQTPTRGVALLSEPYLDAGLTAEVNGGKTEVLRLNHTLRGVYLAQPGRYRVSFRYAPPHWLLARALFVVAGLVLLVASIGVLRRGR